MKWYTNKRFYLLFYILLLHCLPAHSFPDVYSVTTKDGLHNNTIYDVCHTKVGRMWFATDMGLSRYDGFRFRNFPLTSHVDSLSYPIVYAIRSIVEDENNLLYLNLLQGGIACFDPLAECYLPIQLDAAFRDEEIGCVAVVGGQTICIGTSRGLYTGKIEMEKGKKTTVVHLKMSEKPLITGEVSQILVKEKEALFVCVDNWSLWRCNPVAGTAEMLQAYARDRKISTFYLQNKLLWVGFEKGGLKCYDSETGDSREIGGSQGENLQLLSNAFVTALAAMDERNYFVATLNGLFLLTFRSDDIMKTDYTVRALSQEKELMRNELYGKLTDLCWDQSQETLWTATYGYGVVKIDFTRNFCERILQHFDATITGIEQDAQGYLWVTTQAGGVWRSTTAKVSSETSFALWAKGVDAKRTYTLYKDRNGLLWLGDTVESIVCIDPSKGEATNYELQTKGDISLREKIRSFCLDSRNRLWIGTTGGLICVDNRMEECLCVDLKTDTVWVKDVYSIAEDKEGNIWLGTNRGVKRMEFRDKCAKLFGNYEEKARYVVSPAYSVYANSYNQILVSYSDKVIRIDGRNRDTVEEVFNVLNGFNSGHVYCMVDDQNGNTWLGGNSGIATIRNDRNLFYNFTPFDCCDKVCQLHDGTLLWSNGSELIIFDPLRAKSNPNKSRLVLSELWVDNELVEVGKKVNNQVILTASPGLQREFEFYPSNNNFTFYFSDLQYGTVLRKLASRLLPDGEWEIGSMNRGVSYKHLPTGRYTLQVKQIYPDSTEGETVEISILIKNYWWRSGWAYCVYFLLLMGGVAAVYGFLEYRTKRREKQIAGEMELKETLKLSKMKQEQKQEIEKVRNQLLTLFVQELRTPLSLIIAPLKEMLQEETLAERLLSKVRVAYRNSLSMLDACNQLLAIYTQQPLAEKLTVSPYAADNIVDRVVFSVSELVRINQIDFQYEKKTKREMELWVDSNRIRFVLHNLLSNAFNHVGLSGKVRLSMEETMKDGVAYCTIKVSDSGKKQVKEIRQILDEEFQTDMTAIELGYDAMEKVILYHHGSIHLHSEEGAGTEVTVNIPIGKEILEKDPNILFVEGEEPEEERVESVTPVVEVEVAQEVSIQEEPVVKMSVESPIVARTKKNLLIVEDHKDIRLYLKVLFGKDYNIMMATNGQEGVEMAIKEQPDLILCDVMMPVKDGFECCKEMKEGLDTCHIPFIMLTAKVEDEDVIKGLELGADDYILKPFTPSILKAKVRNLINGRVNLKQMYTKLLILPENGSNYETDEGEEKVEMEDPFITSLVKMIEENMHEPDFNVKRLASDMNMSQPTLYRKVKQSTDFTIIELIRGVRMKKAAVLLKQKVYAVQEVAEMVGYNDIPTFRKHFVDTFGSTPSTYANSMDNS